MKGKVFLVIMLGIIAFWTVNVDAKYLVKEDVEDNSYIIGKHYFTRKKNAEYNYDGSLTTSIIMLAAETIEGGMDKMIIYHKNFLGDWVNGLTGEPINPPEYFEIEDRNLRELPPTPELACKLDSDYSCITYGYGQYSTRWSSGASEGAGGNSDYAATWYVLKNSNDEIASNDKIYYENGKFYGTTNNSNGYEELSPVPLYEYRYSHDSALLPTQFYAIVSRLSYYEDEDTDDEEEIFGEYSTIITNGAKIKFEIPDNSITLKATINDNYNVKFLTNKYRYHTYEVDELVDSIMYYNVKFNLEGVDSSKYLVKEYRVYSDKNALMELPNIYMNDYLRNAEGGSEFTLELFRSNLQANSKGNTGYKYSKGHLNYDFNRSNVKYLYMVADVPSEIYSNEYFDVVNRDAYSRRLIGIEEPSVLTDAKKGIYYAEVELCNKNNLEQCYLYTTPKLDLDN